MLSVGAGPPPCDGQDNVEVLRRHDRPGRMSPVTVIISLYNYSNFVASCLESVEAQTQDDLDLVVVDDCSTDQSTEVVASWLDDHAGRFNRCRLVRSTTTPANGATKKLGI